MRKILAELKHLIVRAKTIHDENYHPEHFVVVKLVDPKKGMSIEQSEEYPDFFEDMTKMAFDKLIHMGYGNELEFSWGFEEKPEAKKFMDKLKKHKFIKKWKSNVSIE